MPDEALKLPICPRCHDTDRVVTLPLLALNNYFACVRCRVEWSQSGVRELPEEYPLVENH